MRTVGGKEAEVQVREKENERGEAVRLERSWKKGGEGRRGPSVWEETGKDESYFLAVKQPTQ